VFLRSRGLPAGRPTQWRVPAEP